MMGLETIRQLSREQAEVAAKSGKRPFVPEASDYEDWQAIAGRKAKRPGQRGSFPFPNLGSYDPPGWSRVESAAFFVDKSGFGSSNEPALTVAQFVDRLTAYAKAHPDHGYGITEEGQFQIYVTPFKPVKRKRGRYV